MVILCILLLGLAALPANASGPADGLLVFMGTASLELVPCSGTCHGEIQATVDGAFKGKDGPGSKWEVVLKNATMTADVTYNEPPATCPLTGTAEGSVSISGGTIVAGRYRGTPVRSLSAVGHFDWTREANVAVINLSLTVTLDRMGAGPQEVIRDGRFLQTFAVLGIHSLTDCQNPLPRTFGISGIGVLAGQAPSSRAALRRESP